MSDLTETEIFDCLKANLKKAAEDCDLLAKLPARGPTYNRMREELKLIEGACRQAAHWRRDSRWLTMGIMMEHAHQRAGHWLRRHHPRPLFLTLAEKLREFLAIVERLETRATGQTGALLPTVQAPPARQGRPVSVKLPDRVSPGGMIIPHTATVH